MIRRLARKLAPSAILVAFWMLLALGLLTLSGWFWVVRAMS